MRNVVKIFLFVALISIASGFQPGGQPTFKLIVFEGSDWCINCCRLEKNILNDSIFQMQLQRNSIILERIDFPQRNKLSIAMQDYNKTVAEQYAFDGSYPTLVLCRTDTLAYRKILFSNQPAGKMLEQILSVIPLLQ